jgi:hypothetical protein
LSGICRGVRTRCTCQVVRCEKGLL